jgi:hypothetical protein
MTPERLLAALDTGHVRLSFDRQRRYAVSPADAQGPILFITVSEDDEPCLEDAYIVDEDMHEHPLSPRQRIAATTALRRSF